MTESESKNVDRLIDHAAALRAGENTDRERRSRDRVPLDLPVALIFLSPDGFPCEPLCVRAKDISGRGMCVASRSMIYVDAMGAAQLQRSDGRTVLVGVQVKHCRYVGRMKHETGLEFIPLPVGLSAADFHDENGPVAAAKSPAA